MSDRFAALRSALSLVHRCARRVRDWAVHQWRDGARRDRAQATATFAVIGVLTLASIDYLICGGVDWNPGGEAYAMEVAPPRAPRAAPTAAAPRRMTAPLHPSDHSVVVEELLGGPGADSVALAGDIDISELRQFK